MTNENVCALAPFCKHAGKPDKCTDQCPAFISVNSRYAAADIPVDYAGIYLANSPAADEQASIYNAMNTYVETFSKDDLRIKSLYLYSKSPGTGKTTTSVALLNEYIRRRFMYYVSKKRNVPEVLALFLDLNQFQTAYNLATMSKDDEDLDGIKEAIKRYSDVEFLVIDDVGVRSATEAFRAMVHSIVNARVTNHRPTVYTSNVRMTDLGTVFDARLADRIKDQTAELAFKGESHRGKR